MLSAKWKRSIVLSTAQRLQGLVKRNECYESIISISSASQATSDALKLGGQNFSYNLLYLIGHEKR